MVARKLAPWLGLAPWSTVAGRVVSALAVPRRALLPKVLSSRGAADAEGLVEALAERGLFARAARRCASRGAKAKQGTRVWSLPGLVVAGW